MTSQRPHLLTPFHWGLGLQHRNFGGHKPVPWQSGARGTGPVAGAEISTLITSLIRPEYLVDLSLPFTFLLLLFLIALPQPPNSTDLPPPRALGGETGRGQVVVNQDQLLKASNRKHLIDQSKSHDWPIQELRGTKLLPCTWKAENQKTW